ncbi:signal recognition particle-docking protein FtsY [Candidatus Micrarchaeota archaeon]|nr:signal recognition particle-docking protein FtsY [Candidatus Micrarchaeota archaeon]
MTGSTSQPLSEQLEKDEEEIEELVGGTVEGSIKKEQQRIEKKIVEHKRREDVSKHVFQDKKKESFLVDEKERELKPRVGLLTQLKGVITGGITISEKETEPLFEDLEMALLESDVSMDTAQALVADLRKRLVGKRVARGNVEEEVKKEIAFALSSVMHAHKTDFVERISEAKKQNRTPYVVLFLGPNGAGKTTTIAKIAYQLRQSGFTSVISASDTFRAAAIEQAEYHGKKLGVKVIRHRYGADPAAVAFDAIAHAKSTGIDVVLIDTAGRQETNRNLLAEMEKIVRISQPDLKVFVAEAIAGTSMVQQLKKFHEKLGVDGIILTKLDCDAKGGGSLSISFECQLPILFVGVGQSYDDLKPFNEEWIVRNIMAE